MPTKLCSGCGLTEKWCCCSQIIPTHSSISFALVLNENEPSRPTTTSKIVQKALLNTQTIIWQRAHEPSSLLKQINSPDTEAWLLFPADRTELLSRQKPFNPTTNKKTLIIVPDGTWKEVRKIVRKSPWLDQLPIIAFKSEHKTRYTLRRNKQNGQLCTAEAVSELLQQKGDIQAAQTLEKAFNQFMEAFHMQRHDQDV
ncbi:MAG: tRNA-uridine aminocarboxypropyltransferase [Neptuniibacter sp.]